MRIFSMPLLTGDDLSLNYAIGTMVEHQRNGLLYLPQLGLPRLVDYAGLVATAEQSATQLLDAPWERAIDLRSVPVQSDGDYETILQAENCRFGLISVEGDEATLASWHENFSDLYEFGVPPSSRCTRPGKPAGRSNQDWYHYYPPTGPRPAPGGPCKLCTGTVP